MSTDATPRKTDVQDDPLRVSFDVLGAILIIVMLPLMVALLGLGGQ